MIKASTSGSALWITGILTRRLSHILSCIHEIGHIVTVFMTTCITSETSALQSSTVAKHIVRYGCLYIAVQQCFPLPCFHCMAFGKLSPLVSPSIISISLILRSLS